MALALFSGAVRLVGAIATGGLSHPESFEYDWIARSIVAGHGFMIVHLDVRYYSFAAPLYSWLAVPGLWLFDSLVPVMLLQIFAGAALAVVTSMIAEHLSSQWIASAAAGFLVATHPGLIIYSAAKAHPLAFDALFFALALLQSFRVAERPTVKRAVILGLIVGVGALSRATIIILLPIAGLWLLVIMPKRQWLRGLRNLAIATLCAAAIIAPWTIRNTLLHHQFVFLLTTDSEDFWRGNNPNATGGSYVDGRKLVIDTLSPPERAAMRRQPNEIAQANWFAAQSKAFIQAHPLLFVRMTLVKLFHFWWFAPQTGVEYSRSWLYLYMAYYVIGLLLAAAGLWGTIKRGPPASHFAALIIVFVLALSLLQSLYYVEGRHRWGIEPLILALAGVGFATLAERIARRTSLRSQHGS